MNIFVIGGGPAGLCFALLHRLHNIADDVTVVDRGCPTETYGWGITLPERTLGQLEAADPVTARHVRARSVVSNHIEVFHRGRRVDVAGPPLLGIARLALLNIFQERCLELGVGLKFGTAIEPSSLSRCDCDLVVVADGAHSTIRGAFADDFGTSARPSAAQYAWLGSPHVVPSLALAFEQNADGVFIAIAYPSSSDASTVIVQCGGETWTRARLGERSSPEVCAYLADVFAGVLKGQALLYRRSVRWTAFTRVRNERWYRRRMILLGDAAHAVHFSLGSGTMLAIEDALALAEQLRQQENVDAALSSFERRRKSEVRAVQDAEDVVVNRLEHMEQYMAFEPLDLVYLLFFR